MSNEIHQSSVGHLQKLFDWFCKFRRDFANRLAFLSMRFYGFEDVSLDEINRGAYDNVQHENRKLENINDTKPILSMAKECFEESLKRRAAITDKCKTLLTVSSILLGLIGLLLPKSFTFDASWMRVICFLAILGLFNVIVLLLTFFSVGKETRIALHQSDIDLEPTDFEKNYINLYLQCEVATDNRTDYLVDLYKVARFFFLSSFSFVVILFSVSFLSNTNQNDTKNILQELQSNPELRKLLCDMTESHEGSGDGGIRGGKSDSDDGGKK